MKPAVPVVSPPPDSSMRIRPAARLRATWDDLPSVPIRRPRVLVVDDDPFNRDLLKRYLSRSPYEVIALASGEEAIEHVTQGNVDLVLLDAMMPRIDGFETARRIREKVGEEFLPVVIITALATEDAKLRGLSAGADEFLYKPINGAELQVRVRNLLRARDQHQRLAEANSKLEELSAFRDEMAALLVHDLKIPLSALQTNLEFALSQIQAAQAAPGTVDALGDCVQSAHRLFGMIANLLDIARSEAGKLVAVRKPTNVTDLLRRAIAGRERDAKLRNIEVSLSAVDVGVASLDCGLMSRVLDNIVDNATRHTPVGGRIAFSAERVGERLIIECSNTGNPVDGGAAVFEKFTRGETGRVGNQGLGLYFCRLALEAHGGMISLRPSQTWPVVFRLEIIDTLGDAPAEIPTE
jgi:two-component system sensor histidine kinase/response regulator